MADVIRNFRYTTPGRGRGVLGLCDLETCRRPGRPEEGEAEEKEEEANPETTSRHPDETPMKQVLLAMFDYEAKTDSPGGFKELSLTKGQMLTFLGEHNEHWWMARDSEGVEGCVPSSYVILKNNNTTLPWLEHSALLMKEEERKERVKRQMQLKQSESGNGFPPPPLQPKFVKPYVSAYNREAEVKGGPSEYFCEVCNKHLNGPKPYQAHLASKAHKEEVAAQQGAY